LCGTGTGSRLTHSGVRLFPQVPQGSLVVPSDQRRPFRVNVTPNPQFSNGVVIHSQFLWAAKLIEIVSPKAYAYGLVETVETPRSAR
jgi:hypothetical protein